MSRNNKRIVVVLCGNAILHSKNLSSYEEQFEVGNLVVPDEAMLRSFRA